VDCDTINVGIINEPNDLVAEQFTL
jgi:hypothetical protein